MPGAKMTARELIARLQRHYIKPGEALPGGIFLPEVTHGGYNGRRVDALYVGFTSSRGHLLVGHELKVARSDWLHELDQIEKAETWASQCHAWYLVVPDTSVARPEELPHGWGLMVVDPKTKTRLQVLVRADVDKTRQPDWITVHSILKRIDTLRALAVSEAREAERRAQDETIADLRRQAAALNLGGTERLEGELERARSALAEICQILGIERIAGTDSPSHFAGTKTTSIDELRTAFAEYLRAGRDVDAALAWKLNGLDQSLRNLTAAHDALSEANRLLERHAIGRRSR